MRIKRIYIENYKSIKKIDLCASPKVNVFIGENSVGKSNIFSAVTWLLGPVYPSFNNISNQDHYKGKPENKIKVAIQYEDDTWIAMDESIGRLKKNKDEFINDQERQSKFCSAYLGVDRQIVDYLPSNRWSLLGRILLQINQHFLEAEDDVIDEETGEIITVKKSDRFKQEIKRVRDEILFSVKDTAGNEIMKNFVSVLQRESAKQLNKPENDFHVDLNLYDPWNFFRTLQLIVHEHEMGMKFQASELGMGVQASISIAILRAYSELKLKNKTPIFIDEPELFLHPLAQRNFYGVINELAESGTQVFMTTHSPTFLNIGRFNEIFLVRKTKEGGTCVSCAKPEAFVKDFEQRYPSKKTCVEDILLHYRHAFENTCDSQKANEAFFAKKVLLVEGESESIILPYFFRLLEYDYNADGLVIVNCGGKSELDRFCRLYTELGIPVYIVFDGDKYHEPEKEDSIIAQNRAITGLFGNSIDFPDNSVQPFFLGFETRLENNLSGLTVGKDVKALKLNLRVRLHIQSPQEVPSWVAPLIAALKSLPETVESLLLRSQREEIDKQKIS
jgi:putative ATP-dependent endonuclease of OLD family